MKEYIVSIELRGYVDYEPSTTRCRGSYLDAIRDEFTGLVDLKVWAKDEADAKRLAECHEFTFNGEWRMHGVDGMEVLSIVPTGVSEDDDCASEVLDEEYGWCTSDNAYYGDY